MSIQAKCFATSFCFRSASLKRDLLARRACRRSSSVGWFGAEGLSPRTFPFDWPARSERASGFGSDCKPTTIWKRRGAHCSCVGNLVDAAAAHSASFPRKRESICIRRVAKWFPAFAGMTSHGGDTRGPHRCSARCDRFAKRVDGQLAYGFPAPQS